MKEAADPLTVGILIFCLLAVIGVHILKAYLKRKEEKSKRELKKEIDKWIEKHK